MESNRSFLIQEQVPWCRKVVDTLDQVGYDFEVICYKIRTNSKIVNFFLRLLFNIIIANVFNAFVLVIAAIVNLLFGVVNFLIAIPRNIIKLGKKTGKGCKNIGKSFISFVKEADPITYASCIIMGLGCYRTKAWLKMILYFLSEVAYILYMIFFGGKYLAKFGTLGTVLTQEIEINEPPYFITIFGDNSMLILLYGVITILITCLFAFLFVTSVKSCLSAQKEAKNGIKAPTIKEELADLLDKKFHMVLLFLPILGIVVFTIIPLIYMILIAFTNFDSSHQPPNSLFTWTGLETFARFFNSSDQLGYTFSRVLGWTLIWAVIATFSSYICGMLLAIFINKKNVKLKRMWRTFFVMTVAIPQFVLLLIVRQMFQDTGVVNGILMKLGMENPIKFLSAGPSGANGIRAFVLVINLWIGIPYTLLITSGILMNIPSDLYEAAKIDGANPVQAFKKITLPYMLFVTAPYLITQFIGNINNFNVIYLLTGGAPLTNDYYQAAGKLDLLVTWLYKLSVEKYDYNVAACIGILVFIVCAAFSLIVYNKTGSVKEEDTFS